MEHDQIRTCIAKFLNIAVGTVYHKMHVKKHIRRLAQRLQNGNTYGNIGNEQPVHHVEVEIVGSSVFDIINILNEVGKICCQN